MKIYTKHVSQWLPDGSLVSVPAECESFDYEGPVTQCGAGGRPMPAPQLPYTRTGALSQTGQHLRTNLTGQPTSGGPLGGVQPQPSTGFGPPTGGALGGIFGQPGAPQMPMGGQMPAQMPQQMASQMPPQQPMQAAPGVGVQRPGAVPGTTGMNAQRMALINALRNR